MSADVIAISSFERRNMLTACLECLAGARGHREWDVVVHDDASTEYDIQGLLNRYYPRGRALRNETNLGCDENNFKMLRSIAGTGAKRVLVLDSDLILAPDALEFANRTFPQTDGVLSLFNSNHHPVDKTVSSDLVTKSTIGSAGTLWDGQLLGSLLGELEEALHFDWKLPEAVLARGLKIHVARQSRVQHIGVVGWNARGMDAFDWGQGYRVETQAQARAIAMTHAHWGEVP